MLLVAIIRILAKRRNMDALLTGLVSAKVANVATAQESENPFVEACWDCGIAAEIIADEVCDCLTWTWWPCVDGVYVRFPSLLPTEWADEGKELCRKIQELSISWERGYYDNWYQELTTTGSLSDSRAHYDGVSVCLDFPTTPLWLVEDEWYDAFKPITYVHPNRWGEFGRFLLRTKWRVLWWSLPGRDSLPTSTSQLTTSVSLTFVYVSHDAIFYMTHIICKHEWIRIAFKIPLILSHYFIIGGACIMQSHFQFQCHHQTGNMYAHFAYFFLHIFYIIFSRFWFTFHILEFFGIFWRILDSYSAFWTFLAYIGDF